MNKKLADAIRKTAGEKSSGVNIVINLDMGSLAEALKNQKDDGDEFQKVEGLTPSVS